MNVTIALNYSKGDYLNTLRINSINYFHFRKSKPWYEFLPKDKPLKKHPQFIQNAFNCPNLNKRKGVLKIELDSDWKRDFYLKDKKFFFNNKFLMSGSDSFSAKSIDFKQKLSALKFEPMKIEAQTFISNFEEIVDNLELSELAKAIELKRFFLPSDKLEIKDLMEFELIKIKFLAKYGHIYGNLIRQNQELTVEKCKDFSTFIDEKLKILEHLHPKNTNLSRFELLINSLPNDFIEKIDFKYLSTIKTQKAFKEYLLLVELNAQYSFSVNDSIMEDANQTNFVKKVDYNYEEIARNHEINRIELPNPFSFDSLNNFMER